MARKPSKSGKKAPPKPRNVAAKALAEGQFRPRVEADPKAYRRRGKHPEPLVPPDGEGGDKD